MKRLALGFTLIALASSVLLVSDLTQHKGADASARKNGRSNSS